jgi:phage tail sheath protein FI
MVVTLIGIAPVKPAEFIVFRISQFQSGVEIETQGGA